MFDILFPEVIKIKRPIELRIIAIKNKSDIPEVEAFFSRYTHINLHISTRTDWEQDSWIYDEISNFDIGVAPLNDHVFNVSKSAFKIKQYLSVGIPTVASDVGENGVFIEDGHNGLLVRDGESMSEAIVNLLNLDDNKYFEMSANAINGKQAYSVSGYARQLLNIWPDLK